MAFLCLRCRRTFSVCTTVTNIDLAITQAASRSPQPVPQFAYKGFEEELWSIQKSTTFLSLTILSKSMSASNIPVGEDYVFQFAIEPSNPLYMTGNGEGNQLTVEKPGKNKNVQVN